MVEKPVAICRLKRVAADLRGDIADLLPRIPAKKNGKRVACIGAGPASLTVANDLMPHGYSVTIFEKYDKPGGLMRTNIPSFRLPEQVLTDEIDAILNMGVEIRYNSPVDSLQAVLDEGFDAVFVGSGAPRGKDLELPGRHDTDRIHIGIDWLGSVAFGHIDSIGEKVLIIGVGNTAMDCCRSSRRLGGKDIKVMARRPRGFFKASPWELDDAEEEGIDIVINHAPKRFVIEDGKLIGMEFDRLEWDADAKKSTVLETVILPCDDVILAIGQENAFPWIERDLGIEFDKWDMPAVDETTFQSTRPGVFFGGDAAWGPKNIIWAVEHGHQAAISIDQPLPAGPGQRAPRVGHESDQPEDGHQRVELPQRLQSGAPPEDEACGSGAALRRTAYRSGTRLQRGTDGARSAALPELRCRDRVHRGRSASSATPASISARFPVSPSRPMRRKRCCGASVRARAQSGSGALRIQAAAADRPPDAEGRRSLRPLRPVRGALPHGRVGHAEIRVTDFLCRDAGSSSHIMRSRINDFAIKLANVNGTGSASANSLIMQAIFRMGVPVSGKNLFPSNIQGLPTWYEIRVNRTATRRARSITT